MKHTFSLRTEWTGDRGTGTSGVRDYDRSVVIQEAAVGEIHASAARPFRGDDSKWNPETLLLGALAQCHVLSYLHVAATSGLVVTGMACAVEGVLEVDEDGAGRFTAITLRPEVVLQDEADRARADALHEEAHRLCFIANSLSAPVAVEPARPGGAAPADGPALPDHSARLGAPLAVLRPRVAKRPSRVTGLADRPTEVEPVTKPGAPAPVDQVRARDAAAGRTPSPATPAPATPASATAAPGQAASFYEAVGGRETFDRLTAEFYARVREDELLAPMYPQDDFEGAQRRLLMFLEQYWGGPRTYSEERGHPRLRMRHAPYRIDPAARDAWLTHMRAAVGTLELSPLHEAELWDYLERAAHSLQNSA